MNITIIAVGQVKEAFYRDAITEYTKRLSRYCKLQIIEVNDEKTKDGASEAENELVLHKEGERILNHIKDTDYCITLEIEGKKQDSLEFSKMISDLGIQGKSDLCFVIGGSLGLSKEVKARSNYKLSFSDMTFPHQLMRVILLEQIYRGYRIMRGEPYHK